MKKTLYVVILIVTCIGFSQNLTIQNGVFNRYALDILFDSGEEFGNYTDNESLTTTICPDNGDEFTLLNFTEFNTPLNEDVLTVNDDDTTAVVFSVASSGNISATTSNTTSSQPMTFTSGVTGNLLDREAEISSAIACQDIDASIDSTAPAPNASGVITILPGESVNFSGSAIFSIDAISPSL